MSDFWKTDTPIREDEAFELLQFGAIQVNDDSEYPAAIARTERRMLNCARFYTKRIATLESELAQLRSEVEGMREEIKRLKGES